MPCASRRWIFWVFAPALAACATPTSPQSPTAHDPTPALDAEPEPPTMTRAPGPKTPQPRRDFVAGPALAPADALLDWLKAHPDTLVRLPVVVRFADDWRHTLAEVYIGSDPDPAAARPADAITLHLDDTALGISLSDRLARLEPAAATVIVLQVEGFFRPSALAALEDDAQPPPPWPFSLRDVGPTLEPGERPEHVLVGADAP